MKQLALEFAARAVRTPEAVAVIDAYGEHRMSDIAAGAQRLAAALAKPLQGRPTVLVQADNTWRTLTAALAVGHLDGLVAVVSRHATAAEIALALTDLRPDALIAAPESLRAWGLSKDEYGVAADVLDGWTLRSRPGRTAGTERWSGGCVVAMTSGSTGRPKCVVQSEASLRYAGGCTVDAVGLRAGDPVGALVPLSSVAAFCFGLYLPAMIGSPQVCLDTWKPADALDLLRDSRSRWTMLVPTMALQLAAVPSETAALTAMTAITVGGGPMNAAALERAEKALGTRILRVFGMSECLGHTTSRPQDPVEIRLGRDGRPFPGTQVRVVGDDGAPMPPDREGHAQVRGPSLFVGYARDGAVPPPDLTPDGFLVTGDLAAIGTDGTVRILGREKQVIIRGGRNIDINEVEAALATMPVVSQVCVVPVPDDVLGERAAALLVTTGVEVTLSDVTAHLAAAGFAKPKWPEFVHVVAQLPQNRVGKLSRPDATALATRLSATAEDS
jgi:acyl-CoA synthetase (AMP-forming)/AMP-acid ligase II